MTTAAIVSLVTALMPLVTTGAQHLIAFIEESKTTLQQTGEWTDLMEANYRAALLKTNSDPAYQPDAKS